LATTTAPTLADIEAARERLAGRARVTPVYGSETFARICGTRTWFKAENLQRTGSFKIRGAVNKLTSLGETERAAGVIAASAGNHGQAVAWAARELGISATVFMPQDAPMAKVEATRNYGAQTVLAGAMFDDALAAAMAHAEETGATFVHAFEDTQIIAGQGTIGLELAEQLQDAQTFRAPDRRRRARVRHRDRAACATPGGANRRRAGREDGPRDDRRRHRRKASGRADDGDPR
jgi:threonine dehydratase